MDALVKNTRNELVDYIDSLVITEDNYDNLLNLVQNCDDALFTKIMEELKNGNLVLNDFIRKFSENDEFEQIINSQEKTYKEHMMLRNRLIELTNFYKEALKMNNYTKFLETDKLPNLITTYENKTSDKVNYSANEIERQNIILSLINKYTRDPLEDAYKTTMLEKVLNSDDTDFIDSMLLSFHDFVVPVDFDHVYLSEYDKNFALENGLTDDDVKKMKSLAAFLSNYFE